MLIFSKKESDIVLPRNLTGFSVIGRIECMLLLTLIANALSLKIFPLTNSKFVGFEGFTDICTQDKTMHGSKHKENVIYEYLY